MISSLSVIANSAKTLPMDAELNSNKPELDDCGVSEVASDEGPLFLAGTIRCPLAYSKMQV
jgi:hypothetical protein